MVFVQKINGFYTKRGLVIFTNDPFLFALNVHIGLTHQP